MALTFNRSAAESPLDVMLSSITFRDINRVTTSMLKPLGSEAMIALDFVRQQPELGSHGKLTRASPFARDSHQVVAGRIPEGYCLPIVHGIGQFDHQYHYKYGG